MELLNLNFTEKGEKTKDQNNLIYIFKLPKEWMSKTFATSTFANGLLAILAGVVANYFAENLNFGPTAPFALGTIHILCNPFYVKGG